MRGQQQGTCRTCKGAAHFYPHLDDQGEPVVDDAGELVGEWAHRNPADWVTNPHLIDAVANAAAEEAG